MEKVLVIGGCGYIGSRLVKFLIQGGYDVASCDLEWFGKHDKFENALTDFAHLPEEYLWQFPTVILLAGHSSVKMCEKNQFSCFQNNVVNFVKLLPKLKPSQKFIYASSSSIYGGLSAKEMTEGDDEYRAMNYYDLSKYEIDSYAKLSSAQYYGLRFGTVNGFSVNFRTDVMLNAMYKSSIENHVVKISNPKINRPILGLSDLCNAISSIIRNGDYSRRGIYNLASFNSQVYDIGTKAADILNVALEVSDVKTSGVYDFSISTKRFSETFSFEFQDTIQSILDEITRSHGILDFTDRNKPQKYA